MLGELSKVVVEVCKYQHKYNDPDLQAAAALALSKLMIVRFTKFISTENWFLFVDILR